ncbi:MAG: tRNA (adenosine(37)-N6)-threonylcarbamoyltransferase complex dimerization subunit type 1 TsaB [Oscillospiraceae bacterium]|nr:tRNA (adenosine(37)-N6)-threonylcarbamoyltransferase complex dimerization subunit type 1 TsaB [Oscillospiraceae bacterium]
MLILAIESSAKAASAALCRDGELIAQSFQRSALTHSRTLLPMIEDLFRNTEIPKESVDAVAVAHGPGSFTGVRIGVSTAKGLCWGLDKPAVGVSTLEAMARLSECAGEERVICPVMDARRSQVYNALFAWRDGELQRLCPDRAVSAGELAAELKALDRPAWVLGDGWQVCAAALDAAGAAYSLAPELLRYQNAWGVAMAALGKEPVGAEELLPVYLRLSQAERERQERMSEKENLS